MKIIVMCENVPQFREYVGSMLRNRNQIPVKISFKGCGDATIDSVQFLYCNNPNTLRGRSFGKDDRIVKVGSWYNIPAETQEEIVTAFMARIRNENP